MRHSLFAGGKRLRPLLAIAAAEAAGADKTAALLPAAAIECLHTYTLIHDDLPCMDDDDLRRGVPTCHKVYGEATALLAGDALQALAFSLAAQTPVNPVPVVRELAFAAGSTAVVGGQVEDMLSETGAVPHDLDTLHFIQQHKTGDLIRAATRMGALSANASEEILSALTSYSLAIGEAFQIADDILDATSTPDALGKNTGTDAARGKLTAVTLLGLDPARSRLQELTRHALSSLTPLPPPSRTLLTSLALHLSTRTH
jgi:geranylgeranyl diphosphate synthase type II